MALLTNGEQLNAPSTTAHFPFVDSRLNPSSALAARKVAQVPLVYHVPPLMMQPLFLPPVLTFKCPLPLNGGPVGSGTWVWVRVCVGAGLPPLAALGG